MTILSPPPFRIYLLRHAQSGWATPGQRDFDRTLDDTGYVEAEQVADKAADRGYTPDLVICSTAARCRQTSDAIRRAISAEIEFLFVDDLYSGTLSSYLEIIDAQNGVKSVMLIGHNPTMEEVLNALIGPEAAMAAVPGGYPTAGLAVIDHGGDLAVAAARPWILTDFISR